MKAMVGLFHVAMDDSGARMIETIFWSGHQKNGLFVFALRRGEIERPDYCSFGRSRFFFFQSTPFALKLRGHFINISMMILAKGILITRPVTLFF